MTWHTMVYHSATLNELILLLYCVYINSEMVKNDVSDLQHISWHTLAIPFPAPAELLPAATTDECGVGKQNQSNHHTQHCRNTDVYIYEHRRHTKKNILQMVSPSLSRAGTPKGKPATIPPGLPSTDACFFLLEVKWEGDWRDLLFVPCSMIRCEHLEQNDWYELQTKQCISITWTKHCQCEHITFSIVPNNLYNASKLDNSNTNNQHSLLKQHMNKLCI